MEQAQIYMANTIFVVGAIALFLLLALACLWLADRIRDILIGRKRASVAIKLLRDHYAEHGRDAPYEAAKRRKGM